MLEIPRVEDNGRLGPVNSALVPRYGGAPTYAPVSYTHLRAHET